MLSKYALRLFMPIAVAALASTATAATMTFSNVTDPFARTYVEDGITVSANGDLAVYSAGTAHIDDGGTSAPSRLEFSMGTAFDAVSFDISPEGFNYLGFDGSDFVALSYENVLVQGFQGAALTSSLMFDMTSRASIYTILLGPAFTNLTLLTIEVLLPPLSTPAGYVFTQCSDSPCSHFEIDNVVLNPVAAVPLPASLPIAATGLALLGLLRRRKNRRS